MENEDNEGYACKKCKDTGKILDKNGMHVCYDCLKAGRLDVHSKEVKETKIKW